MVIKLLMLLASIFAGHVCHVQFPTCSWVAQGNRASVPWVIEALLSKSETHRDVCNVAGGKAAPTPQHSASPFYTRACQKTWDIYIYIPTEIIWVGFWIWRMLKSLMGVQFNERFWTFECARSHEHHIYEEYSWLCISMWYHVSDISNKMCLTLFHHCSTTWLCFRQASLFADYFASLQKSKKQLLGQDLVLTLWLEYQQSKPKMPGLFYRGHSVLPAQQSFRGWYFVCICMLLSICNM